MSFRKPKRGQVQQRISDEERADKARQELFAFHKQIADQCERAAKLYELCDAKNKPKAEQLYKSAAENLEQSIVMLEAAAAERIMTLDELTSMELPDENGD